MRFSWAARMVGSLALIGWLLTRVDFASLRTVLFSIRTPIYLGAMLIGPCFVLLLAGRLQLLLRQAGVPSPLSATLQITWGGQFFNLFLPGSTGGDLFKGIELCRRFPRYREMVIAAVAADRLFALLALAVIGCIGTCFAPLPWNAWITNSGAARLRDEALGIGVVVVAAGFWTVASRRPTVVRMRSAAWRSARQLKRFFYGGPLTWLQLGCAVAVHLTNFAAIYLIGRSLGLDLSYVQILAFIPILMLVLLLPITVNGHGLREFLLVAWFTWQHTTNAIGVNNRELAIGFSLALVTYDMCVALPGGLWWLFRRRRPFSPSPACPATSGAVLAP